MSQTDRCDLETQELRYTDVIEEEGIVMTAKGVLKHRIEETLRTRGPMTVRELSAELGEDTNTIASCVRSMAYAGRLELQKRQRRTGNVWKVP